MEVLWSPIYYEIEGNYFKGKIWFFYWQVRNVGSRCQVSGVRFQGPGARC